MQQISRHFFIILLLICGNVYSQQKDFTPLTDDPTLAKDYRKAIRDRYLKDSLAVNGEYKKYIRAYDRYRYEAIEDMFNEKQLLFNQPAHEFLQKIMDKIYKGNPTLTREGTQFLFSRDYIPNAASFGNGLVIFNISLFSGLQNEAQVAWVLCHEMGHYYLDHTNKTFNRNLARLYSKDVQDKLKEIQKMKYERNKEISGLMEGLVFNSRRHSREHESEADSMALVYMKNSGYDMNEGIITLRLLDSIDNVKYNPVASLPKDLNFSEYPFKEKWMKTEKAFFGGVVDTLTKKEQDSLKTHPDCKARSIRVASFLAGQEKAGNKFQVSEKEFRALQDQFRYEVVQYCFNSKRVSQALFRSLGMYQEEPDNVYLATMVGKCFDEMYQNQKEHTLNRIVRLPSPYVEPKYNVLLQFIQNIRMEDMAALGYYYMESKQGKFGSNEKFMDVLSKCRKNYIQ